MLEVDRAAVKLAGVKKSGEALRDILIDISNTLNYHGREAGCLGEVRGLVRGIDKRWQDIPRKEAMIGSSERV